MGIKSVFSFRRKRQQNGDDPAGTPVSPPCMRDVANDQNKNGIPPVVFPMRQAAGTNSTMGGRTEKGTGISSERSVQPVSEQAANSRTGKTSTSEVGEEHVHIFARV